MLYDIPVNKIEEWKWTNQRLLVQIAIIKKYENELENGLRIVFAINELMKDCGYPPQRYIRHDSFLGNLKSDNTLIEPYKLNGGRLVWGYYGYEAGIRKIYLQYMRQEALELTAKAEIRDGNKDYAESVGDNAEIAGEN